MAHTKIVTEADLAEAVLKKMHEAGITAKSTKADGEIVKMLVSMYTTDWLRDIENYAASDLRHREALLNLKIIHEVLYERKPDGKLKLVQPGRSKWARTLRDAMIGDLARDAGLDADGLAEAYLKASCPSYCRTHASEKEYSFLHSRARHA